MIGVHVDHNREIGSFEKYALKEDANIISGSYLSLLGHPLRMVAMPSVPAVIEGQPEELVMSLVPQPHSLCVESRLLAPTKEVALLLLMSVSRDGDDND